MIKFFLRMLPAMLASVLASAAPPAWDFTRPQPDWNSQRNLTASSSKEGLLLDVTDYDSNLGNDRVQIDPAQYSRVRIVYSAEGFSAPTNGELFFAGKSNPEFADSRSFQIPSLTADGKIHTLTLDVNHNINAGSGQWSEEKLVTRLRLDLVNQFPGKILLKSLEFLPGAPAPVNSLNETNITQGWYLAPAAGGSFQLTAPAGKFQVWLHGADDAAAALSGLAALPGFRALKKPESAGAWTHVGMVENTGTATLAAKLPAGTAGILFTPETTTPKVMPSGVPETVPSEVVFGRQPAKYLPLDPAMPYWKSKLIAANGRGFEVNYTLVRRRFKLPEKPEKAFLQLTADDRVDEISLNGRKLKGLWTSDWKYPSLVEVTRELEAGDNLLCVKYTNSGSIGGLMYDLTVNFADGKSIIIAGDGSEKCLVGATPDHWNAVGFDDSRWSAAERREGPPYEPYDTYILPYIDKSPAHGTMAAVSATVPEHIATPEQLELMLSLKGEPALRDDEIVYARIYPTRAGKDNPPSAFVSGPLSKWSPERRDDGTVTLRLGGFKLPEYGGEFSGRIEYGIYGRTAAQNQPVPFAIAPRPVPGADRPIQVAREAKPDGATVTVDGKPFFPTFLSVFYERVPTGLEGSDSPITVREFLAGGMSNEWWIGPDRYDFSAVDARISKIIREYPNAYIAAWVWCQPPHWYDEAYPDRISKQSDGGVFPYYVSTVTFSDPEYRKDAARAIRAFVEHCEKYFGNKMLAYNLSGGISLEWQGWGCHSQAQRKVLNDYSPAAQRDFKAFVAERYPALKAAGVPSYAERTAPGETVFRDPVSEAGPIAFDEYYSESVADCIALLARAVKEATHGNKLVGAYYGYFFEYGNMGFCVNSSGHNAMNRLLATPEIDFLLSPPSYGVRAPGEPGAEMKVFGSIAASGKFSILEDDTRTHLTSPRDYYQAMNPEQTRNILRRNWGMALSRRTPICMLPLEEGRDLSSPEIRADLEKVRAAGQKLFESDRPAGVEIAVVVDEHSLKYLRPEDKMETATNQTRFWYGHNGKLLQAPRAEQNLTGPLTYYQRIALSRIGAGADWIYLDDVPKLADRYKFWVFLGDFAASPALKAALDTLRPRDVTVLVAYGAGFAGGSKAVDAAAMSNLLGMKIDEIAPGPLKLRVTDVTSPWSAGLRQLQFGGDYATNPRFAVSDPAATVLGRYADDSGAALAEKKVDAMNLIFSGGTQLTPDLLRALARRAGVFIQNDSDDNFFAGYGISAIHAARAGRKIVRFPEPVTVTDLFTGEVLGTKVSAVEFNLKAHETKVLRTE